MGRPGRLWGVSALAALGVAAALALLLARSTDRSWEVVRASGRIRAGYAVEPPYAFLDPEGKVTGHDPALAAVVGRRLDLRLEWRQYEFGSLIPALEAGEVDVIAAGMFITPARARRVAFSEPTFHVRQGLLVRQGNPLGLRSYGQLPGHAEVRVAVLVGTEEERLLTQLGLGARQLVAVPDAAAGLAAVRSSLADGLALSSPTVRWLAQGDATGATQAVADLAQTALPETSSYGFGGFAFRKESRALRDAWNGALAGFLGGDEHAALVARFGFTPAELPRGTSLSQLLGAP